MKPQMTRHYASKTLAVGLALCAARLLTAAPAVVSPADYATVDTYTPYLKAYGDSSAAVNQKNYDVGTEDTAPRIKLMNEYRTNQIPVRLAWSGTTGPVSLVIAKSHGGTTVLTTNGLAETSFDFYNPEIGRNYTWTVTDSSGSVSGHFYVLRHAPRILHYEANGHVDNARDCGGWTNTSGQVVKQGLLYRSSQFDEHHSKTSPVPVSMPYWANTLGIRDDVDLRKKAQIEVNIAEYGGSLAVSPIADTVPRFTSEMACTNAFSSYGAMIKEKGSRIAFGHVFTNMVANLPAVYHCQHGKDRTGSLAYVLNGMLGVPQKDLVLDWYYSYIAKSDFTTDDEPIGQVGDRINERYSSQSKVFATQCALYVKECLTDIGLNATAVQTLMDNFMATFLEDAESADTPPVPPEPTPGIVKTNAMANASWGYEIHGLGAATNEVALVFTNAVETMAWTLPEDVTQFRYLVVAGGGGGGGSTSTTRTGGGGGGAGGFLTGTANVLDSRALTVKVGPGGTAGTGSAYSSKTVGAAGKGGDSTLTLGVVTVAQAVGGGYGAKYNNTATPSGGAGGSGGGGSYNTTSGGTAEDGQGHAGGAGGPSSHGGGGGGGGAGSAGASYNSTGDIAGAGGNGLASDITGMSCIYAAGGGGGGAASGVGGKGGSGGVGGKGGDTSGSDMNGHPGQPGTGSGGGGGGRDVSSSSATKSGGAGASGVVVIRYAAKAGPVSRPLRILTIGNSFSVKMVGANALPKAAALVGCPIDYAHFYKAGATLSDAWNYRGDQTKYTLTTSFASAENPLDALTDTCITNVLKAMDWDIVTLQQGSASSYKSDTYSPYFQKLVSCIKALAPNAKIVWHMTWAYDRYSSKLSGWDFKGDVAQRDRMFDRIVGAYETNVVETAWKTIPTGYAIQRYRYRLPVTNPTDDFTNTDHQHLSVPGVTDANPAGSYMQVLVWCQTLFGTMPSATDYPPSAYSSLLSMTDAEVSRLRASAADACAATSYRDYGQGTVDFRWSVTFKDDDGSVLSSVTVTNGMCATPPAPEREGATLKSWTCPWPVVQTTGVGTETVTATSDAVATKKVYDNLVWTATWEPIVPDPGTLITNAMPNAHWGFEIHGLGAATNEVALVFTNTTETMTWTLPEGVTSIQYLLAGGGGSGGASAGLIKTSAGGQNKYYTSGGGGAGGLLAADSFAVGSRSLTVTVGTGGAAVSATVEQEVNHYANGNDGSNSTLSVGTDAPIVAHGGGGGGGVSAGRAGGSGGGAGNQWGTTATTVYAGGAGTDGEGFAGGSTVAARSGNHAGGGGGGAGGAGESRTGASTTASVNGGAGGAGVWNDILGTRNWFCAGGGGGGHYSTGAGGAGGTGGGGAGSKYSEKVDVTAGSGTTYGSGGGGTAGYTSSTTTYLTTRTSGAGHAGVVIIRYRTGATPGGEWGEIESSQVDGVTAENKAAVETTLSAIQAALPSGSTSADVGAWMTKIYGNQKVSAETLANAKHVGISVKYDLPILVSETPTVTVAAASESVSPSGTAAFVFRILDGETPVSVMSAKVQDMVLYAQSLGGGFAPSEPTQVQVTPDGTAFKAELQRLDGQTAGFMKVELK